MPDLVAACLDGGATFLQIRAKTTSSTSLLRMVDAVLARAEAFGALVVVNDRADVARLAGARAVHIGQDDLPPAAVRLVAGPNTFVGLSTHTDIQVQAALTEPVNYLAIGPVFGTATKATGYDAVGLDMVRHAAGSARAVDLPVVAIGGITLQRAPEVITAGATAVAVIGDLLSTGDPAGRVRAFLTALSPSRS